MSKRDLQSEFEAFDAAHPEIWGQFCVWTDKLIKRGVQHSSATMIIEAVKMEYVLFTGKDLAVPNNTRYGYARKWLQTHKPPEYPWRFFRLAAERSPSGHDWKGPAIDARKLSDVFKGITKI